MKNAVIYTRISRDPEHTELGVKRQERDCRDLCKRVGLNVVDTVVDDDRSAYSGKRRPGYERVLQMVRDGAVNVVVAWHPDRLTRSPRELETLIDTIEAARATVHTVQAGEYDLSTPSGRMTARVVGAVARGESEHKSARLRRKHLELAERGKLGSGGGTRPFGFHDDRTTIDRAEAKLIREAASRVLAGESIRGICADWSARGVAAPSGGAWHPGVLTRLLRSARIAGLREHSSGTYRAEWKPIIDADEHRRLVALLTNPARRTNNTARTYLLAGMIRCELCGARMVARPRQNRSRCYVCASGPGVFGCGRMTVTADPVEALVIAAVLARFDGPALAAATTAGDDAPDDLDALRAIDARTAELGEMWAAGELDKASWTAARRRLEADRMAISDRMRQTATSGAVAPYAGNQGALRAAWPSMSFDQRRAVLVAVVESVTISPAAVRGLNKFDPSRVSINWSA